MENTYRVGHFVWRELMTSDVQKARGFYGELFGWTFNEMQMPMGTYTIVKKDGKDIGGIAQMPPGGAPPAWHSYVSVENVDKAVEIASANGGKALFPADDVPGVGRISMLMDPTGAAIGLLRALTGDPPFERPPVGGFCWETLGTTDIEKSKDFYTKVIGWTVSSEGHNLFHAGKDMVADLEKTPPGVPPYWLLHVFVEKLETAREHAVRLGAKVLMAEIPVPGFGRMAIIADPLGSPISLFEGASNPAS